MPEEPENIIDETEGKDQAMVCSVCGEESDDLDEEGHCPECR